MTPLWATILMLGICLWLLLLTLVVISEIRAIGVLEIRVGRRTTAVMTGDGLPVGEPLPDVSVRDISTGATVQLGTSARPTMVVLLNATCSICRKLGASMQVLYREWGEYELAFVCRGAREGARLMKGQFPRDVAFYWDPDGHFANAMECSITPYAFVCDAQKRVTVKGMANDEEYLNSLIEGDQAGIRHKTVAN